MKSVTALMCVYKTPLHYLRQAVESILCQSYSDFKFMIILDGHDQPEIRVFLSLYSDSRLDIHETMNRGLTKSLNFALSRIDSDFILRQDADDFSAPHRLETLLDKMTSRTGALGDNYAHVDSDGNPIKINNADPENVDPERYRQFGMAGTIAGGGVLLRRKAIEDVGGWCYPVAQDCYMWHAMKAKGWRVRSLDETLYFWRHHSGQITVNKKSQQEMVVKKILREFEDNTEISADSTAQRQGE